MVKTKHQKSDSKKQPHAKKHGKQSKNCEFSGQLDALGLKIIHVNADGNCFFRALADQLEGNEEVHVKYRSMAVKYIQNNRERFEPFIEDDMPFDEYCLNMEKDGTWAGNMELQAASLITHTNICIHRSSSPRWYIKNFDDYGARMIHLSYHDGEHYNSVRLKEDTCTGPAKPITIKADAVSANSHQAKAATMCKGGTHKTDTHEESIKMVMAGSGCYIAEKVEQIFLQVGGDVDVAIEFLIAEKGAEEFLDENTKVPCATDTSHGDDQNQNSDPPKDDLEGILCEPDSSRSNIQTTHDSNSLRHVEKIISRNKACPCRSKKKYKSCCGTVAGRSSVRLAAIRNQAVDNGKGRKHKKQGKKSGPPSVTPSRGSEGQLDMGALCI